MVTTFLVIMLGIASRLVKTSIPGLDAYAGYSIAAALFLALPAALQHGDHIRVTLVLERLTPAVRTVIEWWCLLVAAALATYMAWFAVRFVWLSKALGEVSTSADATPLWIPQIAVAVGCVGFALSFFHATVLRIKGRDFIKNTSEGAHVE